ncbi:MAG: GNAT family N-acetyltransferase [Lawsonibacter sp.]
MAIRIACTQDAQALLDIYQAYIDTSITFEYDLPSVSEFTNRISSTLTRYPYLVWEENGVVLGYAYAHPERERQAYQWNAELSIYLAPTAVGRGVGRKLYLTLMDLLRLQGVKTVYGVVTSPNPASEGLHTALGFRLLGVHRNTGYKNGQWHDVLWFEKPLSPYCQNPEPVIPFPQLDATQVTNLLNSYTSPVTQ